MIDPTLPGTPQDAIDHAANVERARVLLDNPAPPPLADVYVERVAEALTAAELRGFAAGVASTKPVVRRNCYSCQRDRLDDGYHLCDGDGSDSRAAQAWADEHVGNAPHDLMLAGLPSPDADNCPGWAPKSTETTP